jgi:type I restriction enzyme S subunit
LSNTQLPNGWVTAPLIDTIGINGTLCDGDWVESKDQDERGNIRLIQLADIGDGNFKNKSNRFINEDAFSRLGCTEINIGDILIARLPDPLGRACIFPNIQQRAVTVVDVCIIRTGNNSINATWLKYWINSPEVRRLIELQASGTTRKRISRTKLESLILPLPPLAEQKQIATLLDK